MGNLSNILWVAKYAPKTLDETILNKEIKKKLKSIIETKEIPNLGFFGPQGTGKTTTAKALLNDLGVQKEDILFINASDVNSVESVRNRIKPFAESMSTNEELPLRFVLLDEADHLSPQAQAALRSLIEAVYPTARFILTANYPKKIIPALHSRLQVFTLSNPPMKKVLNRIIDILEKEEVIVPEEYEDDLIKLVENYYKDIRKLIQLIQQNIVIIDGEKVFKPVVNESEQNEVFSEYIKLFRNEDVKGLRELIYKEFTDSDITEFWTLMTTELLENHDIYENVGAGLDNIILYLNEGQKNHEFVANKHLNLLAFTISALLAGAEGLEE